MESKAGKSTAPAPSARKWKAKIHFLIDPMNPKDYCDIAVDLNVIIPAEGESGKREILKFFSGFSHTGTKFDDTKTRHLIVGSAGKYHEQRQNLILFINYDIESGNLVDTWISIVDNKHAVPRDAVTIRYTRVRIGDQPFTVSEILFAIPKLSHQFTVIKDKKGKEKSVKGPKAPTPSVSTQELTTRIEGQSPEDVYVRDDKYLESVAGGVPPVLVEPLLGARSPLMALPPPPPPPKEYIPSLPNVLEIVTDAVGWDEDSSVNTPMLEEPQELPEVIPEPVAVTPTNESEATTSSIIEAAAQEDVSSTSSGNTKATRKQRFRAIRDARKSTGYTADNAIIYPAVDGQDQKLKSPAGIEADEFISLRPAPSSAQNVLSDIFHASQYLQARYALDQLGILGEQASAKILAQEVQEAVLAGRDPGDTTFQTGFFSINISLASATMPRCYVNCTDFFSARGCPLKSVHLFGKKQEDGSAVMVLVC